MATKSSDLKQIAWPARDHAITVLPAVSSLKALRRVARPSTATLPMIGFGNPLLDGDQAHPQFGDFYKRRAELARDKQTCPERRCAGRDPRRPRRRRGSEAPAAAARDGGRTVRGCP